MQCGYYPSARITTLLLRSLVLYINFTHEWWAPYSLKSTPNDEFLRNFSWQYYLILWCFLFYKGNVTLLQGVLKKLLTNPVIM